MGSQEAKNWGVSQASQQGRAWLGSEPRWAPQSQAPILQARSPSKAAPKGRQCHRGCPRAPSCPLCTHSGLEAPSTPRNNPRPPHLAGRSSLARKRGDTGLPQRAARLKPCSAQGEVAPKQLQPASGCPRVPTPHGGGGAASLRDSSPGPPRAIPSKPNGQGQSQPLLWKKGLRRCLPPHPPQQCHLARSWGQSPRSETQEATEAALGP